MKMAKASEADLRMAMDLANVLDDIERGYFPSRFSDDEDDEDRESGRDFKALGHDCDRAEWARVRKLWAPV